MSYDLMVFDTAAAPRDRSRFLTWYVKQVEGPESSEYCDPENLPPSLKEWFREIIKTFPPLNGPLANNDEDNSKITDYSLGRSFIYGCFAWSEAETAYKYVKELAAKYAIGFFDASSEHADIWWPVPGWKLCCEGRGEIPFPLNLDFVELMNKLDPKGNSFYILEHENGNYMQCGGGKAACTVEYRVYSGPDHYQHYVVGHASGSSKPSSIKMSDGEVSLLKRETLNSNEAATLFSLFLRGEELPTKYAVRAKE